MLNCQDGSVPRYFNGPRRTVREAMSDQHAIDVATIVGALAAGESADTLATEYSLSIDQVRSSLAYVAHIAAHLPPAVRQAS